MGAIKNFEKAIENRPKVDYYYRCAICCLGIIDHVPKLEGMFFEKALTRLQQGQELDPQNKTLTRLFERLQADPALMASANQNTDSG